MSETQPRKGESKSDHCSLQNHHAGRLWIRQDLVAAALLLEHIQPCAELHHRSRVQNEAGENRRSSHKALALGYCGVGALPIDIPSVPAQRPRLHSCVRHNPPANFHKCGITNNRLPELRKQHGREALSGSGRPEQGQKGEPGPHPGPLARAKARPAGILRQRLHFSATARY